MDHLTNYLVFHLFQWILISKDSHYWNIRWIHISTLEFNNTSKFHKFINTIQIQTLKAVLDFTLFSDVINFSLVLVKCIYTIHTPGMGNWVVSASTLLRRFDTLSVKGKSGAATNFKNSWSFDPEANPLASIVICTPSWMKSAIAVNSFSVNPLVVIAGDPMRMPPGTSALLSPGKFEMCKCWWN